MDIKDIQQKIEQIFRQDETLKCILGTWRIIKPFDGYDPHSEGNLHINTPLKEALADEEAVHNHLDKIRRNRIYLNFGIACPNCLNILHEVPFNTEIIHCSFCNSDFDKRKFLAYADFSYGFLRYGWQYRSAHEAAIKREDETVIREWPSASILTSNGRGRVRFGLPPIGEGLMFIASAMVAGILGGLAYDTLKKMLNKVLSKYSEKDTEKDDIARRMYNLELMYKWIYEYYDFRRSYFYLRRFLPFAIGFSKEKISEEDIIGFVREYIDKLKSLEELAITLKNIKESTNIKLSDKASSFFVTKVGSTKFHRVDCRVLKNVSQHRLFYLNNREEAIEKLLIPCKICQP